MVQNSPDWVWFLQYMFGSCVFWYAYYRFQRDVICPIPVLGGWDDEYNNKTGESKMKETGESSRISEADQKKGFEEKEAKRKAILKNYFKRVYFGMESCAVLHAPLVYLSCFYFYIFESKLVYLLLKSMQHDALRGIGFLQNLFGTDPFSGLSNYVSSIDVAGIPYNVPQEMNFENILKPTFENRSWIFDFVFATSSGYFLVDTLTQVIPLRDWGMAIHHILSAGFYLTYFQSPAISLSALLMIIEVSNTTSLHLSYFSKVYGYKWGYFLSGVNKFTIYVFQRIIYIPYIAFLVSAIYRETGEPGGFHSSVMFYEFIQVHCGNGIVSGYATGIYTTAALAGLFLFSFFFLTVFMIPQFKGQFILKTDSKKKIKVA